MKATFPRDGGCRCGRIRFRVSAPPLLAMVCHCRGCQRMTASAFCLSIAVAREAFTILQGKELDVIGGVQAEGDQFHHHHCAHCKSWIYTEAPATMPFVNVRTTMLDDPSGLEPYIETQTAEKLAWAKTPAVHSFERFPPMEQYAALVDEYRRRSS